LGTSLFDLISLSGSASLDELRARSPVDDNTLANAVATMVTSGDVVLSLTPGSHSGSVLLSVTGLLGQPANGEFRQAATMNDAALNGAIHDLLADENVAASVTASPTTAFFKRRLSAS
jgi:hypothetical protein